MRTQLSTQSTTTRHRDFSTNRTIGSALMAVMLFVVVSFVLLGSIMIWAKNNGALAARKYEFVRAQYVAEAGADKFFTGMQAYVSTNHVTPTQAIVDGLCTNQVPTSADHAIFSQYQFIATDGSHNKIDGTYLGTPSQELLTSGTYSGLYALVTSYQVVARAKGVGRPIPVTAAVRRDVNVQAIPIFQFAVFYQGDLEIGNNPPMTITGRVQANGNGYFVPSSSLVFNSPVTLVGRAYYTAKPGDPGHTSPAPTTFNSTLTTQVHPLNMPIGASSPRDILDPPPSSGVDPITDQRLYNKAGMIITVTAGSISVVNASGGAVSLPASTIVTNNSMYDYREGKTVLLTEIDVNKLQSQPPANGIMYVIDKRTGTSSQETAIRLINGGSLPAGGLSVVTPNPLYILGDFNKNNGSWQPCSIVADAINILSANWNDANSSLGLGSRGVNNNMEVNAAFFVGNVPTTMATGFSGGLENLFRFHEDWTSGNRTLTYTGSIVCMFASKYATGPYQNASYNAPTRVWSFDTRFLDPTKLPPGTPAVWELTQSEWASVK